ALSEALVGSRNPMRKIFPGCCASAIVAPTSRITAHRIDAGLFIKHLLSGVIYRAERTDLSNEKCPRSRKIVLNDASERSHARIVTLARQPLFAPFPGKCAIRFTAHESHD